MIDTRWSETTPDKTALLGGIVDDAQQLFKQEVALARREILDELMKAKTAALSMAVAACFSAFAAMFFILGALHWLQWLTQLPLWTCYLIGACSLAAAATILFLMAKNQSRQMAILPQTVETMKENLRWMQDQV
jgi:hypothetical protein